MTSSEDVFRMRGEKSNQVLATQQPNCNVDERRHEMLLDSAAAAQFLPAATPQLRFGQGSQRDRETDRQTTQQTNKQTDRQADRQTASPASQPAK
jgi:hypothetical protein